MGYLSKAFYSLALAMTTTTLIMQFGDSAINLDPVQQPVFKLDPVKGASLIVPKTEIEELITCDGLALHPMERSRLCHIQALDAMEDAEDNDMAFQPEAVLRHRISHQNRRVPIIETLPDGVLSKDPPIVAVRHVRLKVLWKNNEVTWVQTDALRLQQPWVLLKYVTRHKLRKHPDFVWANEYLDDQAALANLARKAAPGGSQGPKYKFGVVVPTSVRHSMLLDKLSDNTLWQDAIQKELDQINQCTTFRSLAKGEVLPSEYKKIPYHFVFDCKFDLHMKARLVADGHCTPDVPCEDVYSGVVAMETIRIGFMLASFNNLECCPADVGNTFLYGKTKEKVYVIAGSEFGDLQGQPMIIDKGRYGLKTSAARFHEHLAAKFRRMGFVPSKADADFWMKKCGDHYEYVAAYVDDLLVFSRKPMAIIEEVKKDYVLKGVGVPEYFLGGNVEQTGTDKFSLSEAWEKENVFTALSTQTYIKHITEKVCKLAGKKEIAEYTTPMSEAYHPEMDDSPMMSPAGKAKYQSLIGCANWVVTLGRFDIAYSLNAMSRFSMAPRVGHFKAMLRVFGYLKRYDKGRIIFDPAYPNHSLIKTPEYDNWQEFYPEATEELPPGVPEPAGRPVRITLFKDDEHARDLLTRRSVTGIILFINNTPIRWVSKHQKTVETSTYGSELVAARIATELVIEYRYNLRMFGVPLDGPALMLGDNHSVILNTTVPSSVLKKKHNACACHRVREAIAAGIMRFAHVSSAENYADIFTKPLPPVTFHTLVKPLLFRTPQWNLKT
jgi:hypothetical protein